MYDGGGGEDVDNMDGMGNKDGKAGLGDEAPKTDFYKDLKWEELKGAENMPAILLRCKVMYEYFGDAIRA